MKKLLLAALVLFSFSSISAYATSTAKEDLGEHHVNHVETRATTHINNAKAGTSVPETYSTNGKSAYQQVDTAAEQEKAAVE